MSNITVGRLPVRGALPKAKPDSSKLVNQFFAKELVNPKPKGSIKIGLISSKLRVPEAPAGTLADGLEICPVSPPDGYALRAAKEAEEEAKRQGQ